MQKIGCPESFTEPADLYRICMDRGMDAVTITDHNVIDACLEIQHLPNTFMGCEYTTYFPADNCKIHLLVYGQTEAQHRDITALRKNIFELTAYLHEQGLRHVCAHPFFGPNSRLDVDHVEQLALLFKYWELNGDQNPAMNAAVRQLVDQMTPTMIARLENKHDMQAYGVDPWKKILTAGSDCHSSLNLAKSWTGVDDAETLEAFWTGFDRGETTIHCQEATPKSFARNVYGIAFQFYKSRLGLDRHVNKDIFLRFLHRALQTRVKHDEAWLQKLHFMIARRRRTKANGSKASSLFTIGRAEAEELIREDPQLWALVEQGSAGEGDMDAMWFQFVNQLSNKMLVHLGEQLLERAVNGRLFELFNLLGNGGALYALLAPYFVSMGHYKFEHEFSMRVLDHFLEGRIPDDFKRVPKVGHFTDTFYDVNGVSRTLQQQADLARELGKAYEVLTCHPEETGERPGVARFNPIGTLQIPEYPELKLLAPPLLEMAAYVYEQGFTHLHVATPGPVGLASIAIARIFRMPISGTYHTAFPEYVHALTDDEYVTDMAWKYMLWFYDQMDTVYVPSQATAEELIARGLNEKKVRVYPRGIDTDRFHPEKRSDVFVEHYQRDAETVRLLYVGRVSREKNLHLLVDAYKQMLDLGVAAELVIVGDGPYREEMTLALSDTSALFTGYLEGEDLAAVYASSDVFVFPSTTDTFGNVVLEAQASGLPVIVTDQGGPQENVLPDETGFVVAADDAETLAGTMAMLARDAGLRNRMGAAARTYLAQRGFAPAFEQLYAMYVECDGKDLLQDGDPAVKAPAFEKAVRMAS